VSRTPFPHFYEIHQFVVDTLGSDAGRVLAPYIEKIRRIAAEEREEYDEIALHLLADSQIMCRPKVEQRLLIAALIEMQLPPIPSVFPKTLGNGKSGCPDGRQQTAEESNDRRDHNGGDDQLRRNPEGESHLAERLPVDR
jgi:hypothetical protein